MNAKSFFYKPLSLMLLCLGLSGCGADTYADNDKEDDDDAVISISQVNNLTSEVSTSLNNVAENTSLPVQARLLAAQCAQCHGTFGLSVTQIDSIQNEADELLEEMAEYRTKTTHIMYPHALAYTDQELTWMSQYFLGLSGTAITSGDNDHD